MGIYECSCLPGNLSSSGKFELCEVCRLEEENEDDNAAEQSVNPTGLTLRQKEEVLQIVRSVFGTGLANPPCG